MFDSIMDLYDTGRKGLDLVGMGEVAAIASTVDRAAAPWASGAGLTEGADSVLGPLGTALSVLDVGKGLYHTYDGVTRDDDVAKLDGVHDLVGGGAGLMGNIPGPVGAVAKAFSGGYALGDMIAPTIFGSEEEDNKPHFEAVPEDGVFKPSTGNQYVDGALDLFGIRD